MKNHLVTTSIALLLLTGCGEQAITNNTNISSPTAILQENETRIKNTNAKVNENRNTNTVLPPNSAFTGLYTSDLGYIINIPTSWKNKYVIVKDKDSDTFQMKGTYQGQTVTQDFFCIGKMTLSDWRKSESGERGPLPQILKETKKYVYYTWHPLDFALDEKYEAQYNEMGNDLDGILKSFTVR